MRAGSSSRSLTQKRLRFVIRYNPIDRRMSKFLREPVSVRTAAGVIVTASALVVVGSGVLMRVLDHHEYASIWLGLWWAAQTVTTVGYGDVTPKNVGGRIVATFVMLEGVALVAVITAAITSTFVERAREERELEATAEAKTAEAAMDARFDDLAAKLDRLEAMLQQLTHT
jgi:voltage-gated potassium channel